jgi:hypothetical protein
MKICIKALLVFISVVSVQQTALANPESFVLRSSLLGSNEVGFFRHVCLYNRQFVSFAGRGGNAELQQIKTSEGVSLSCKSREYSVLKETSVKTIRLQKQESGVIRNFEVEDHLFLLITTKGGGSALTQYY